MTTDQALVPRNRRPRGQHPRRRDHYGRKNPSRKLPEYQEAHQAEALIRAAPNHRARLLFLIEWRAGLRISEALALEARDLSFESELPSIRVREGKGSKPRIVPVHPELHAALTSALQFGDAGRQDRLVRASRATADRWIKAAAARAEEPGLDTSRTPHIQSYPQALLRPPPAGEQHRHQLPVALAGALVDPDHVDLPGTGAGPDGKLGVGAMSRLLGSKE